MYWTGTRQKLRFRWLIQPLSILWKGRRKKVLDWIFNRPVHILKMAFTSPRFHHQWITLQPGKKNNQGDNSTAVSEVWIVDNWTNFHAAFEFGRHEWFALGRFLTKLGMLHMPGFLKFCASRTVACGKKHQRKKRTSGRLLHGTMYFWRSPTCTNSSSGGNDKTVAPEKTTWFHFR